MKVKWLGHASFLITSDNGTRIITDPYIPGGNLNYGEIKEAADIVTVSHEHYDHNAVASVSGSPEVLRRGAKAKGIEFKAISAYHDASGGTSGRGSNTIFCFEVDGVRICHLGDLGHMLNTQQIAEIGKVDVLIIPVGGNYTVDARVATEVCNQLMPGVILPMHFKNDRCTFPISGVEEFLRGKKNVKTLDGSEAEFKKGELPATPQIVVLQPAL